MLEVAQSLSFVIFGFIVILILMWVLVLVHKQSRRVKDLEQQMNLTEKARDAEVNNGKESIL